MWTDATRSQHQLTENTWVNFLQFPLLLFPAFRNSSHYFRLGWRARYLLPTGGNRLWRLKKIGNMITEWENLITNNTAKKHLRGRTFCLTSGILSALYLYLVAYLSCYHEKAMKALSRARLKVSGHLSTTRRRGNPAKCLSQLHNK